MTKKYINTLVLLIATFCAITLESASAKHIHVDIGNNHCEIGFADSDSLSVRFNDEYETVEIDSMNTITSIIQNAINNLTNNGYMNGGTLYLESGTYLINKNLILQDNIKFTGNGIDNTIIKLEKNAGPFINDEQRQPGLIRAKYANNIMILNLTIDGNKYNQYADEEHIYGRHGIYTESCSNVVFDNIKIKNCQGYGFNPHGVKYGEEDEGEDEEEVIHYGNNYEILNCVSEYNDYDGFVIDQTNNVHISNSLSKHNGRHGFNVLTGSQNVTITNSHSNDNGWYYFNGDGGCVYVVQNNQNYGTKNVLIENNRERNSKKAGLCLKYTEYVIISNNEFTDTYTCIEFKNQTYTLINNNNCRAERFYKFVHTNMEYVNEQRIVGKDTYFYENVNEYNTDCSSGEYLLASRFIFIIVLLNMLVNKN